MERSLLNTANDCPGKSGIDKKESHSQASLNSSVLAGPVSSMTSESFMCDV